LQAKSYFVKKGIEFTEVNVEKDRNGQQEMLKKSGGYRGIPLIDINGTILRGFNQRAVDQALNR
jgi:glutaredoxin